MKWCMYVCSATLRNVIVHSPVRGSNQRRSRGQAGGRDGGKQVAIPLVCDCRERRWPGSALCPAPAEGGQTGDGRLIDA
jgi:hypothetical protein